MKMRSLWSNFYTENSQYDAPVGGDGIANTGDDVGVVLPIVPKHRELVLPSTTFHPRLRQMSTFTLQAVPIGTMAGDACGTYTLTNTGATRCWRYHCGLLESLMQ